MTDCVCKALLLLLFVGACGARDELSPFELGAGGSSNDAGDDSGLDPDAGFCLPNSQTRTLAPIDRRRLAEVCVHR